MAEKSTLGLALSVGLLACLGACDQDAATDDAPIFETTDSYEAGNDARPWTHLDFADDPENFQFAVVTDRTGVHRPGVFREIMKKVNLLQPEFIMSVGDYIEGYREDKDLLRAEWAEVDDAVGVLEAPLFFVVGNHDLSNIATEEVWRERWAKTRYHFVYKDVLFLILNTEDPRYPTPEEEALLQQTVRISETDFAAALEFARGQPLLAKYAEETDAARISDAQRDWALGLLEQHQDARWTFIFMHRPIWATPTGNFTALEEALAGRGYTMMAGHIHKYTYTRRQGQDHISLATTGGGWGAAVETGNMDHITWITMRDDGPVFANLVATGILAKDQIPASLPGAEFCGPMYDLPCLYGDRAAPEAQDKEEAGPEE